ncbi:phosphoribosylamine--glycine ligase [bacterium]|nr:phosphoribosylamine--glycine ligase [bacterium]
MKIAIIGSGAREHSIYEKLSRHIDPKQIFALPGNGGILNSVSIDITYPEEVKKYCLRNRIGMVIVGPEEPLVNGMADVFAETSIMVIGPTKNSAQLESSKSFAKRFMKELGIPTPDYREFTLLEDAMPQINALNGNLVLKYDGLAGGKGVYVCSSVEDVEEAYAELKKRYGEEFTFLIEKRLKGEELSLIGVTDGDTIKLFPPCKDYKKLNDGDSGPNTGGMGAYLPLKISDDVMKQIESDIVVPTMRGIKEKGLGYKGFLYFGIIITEKGPRLLEYNVRLGDPETQVLLSSMKTNLLTLLESCFNGTLKEQNVEFEDKYTTALVIASGGYPFAFRTGFEITGLNQISDDVAILHSGTQKKGKNQLLTTSGRVFTLVAKGETLEESRQKVYQAAKKIHFKKITYRKDIGGIN